MDCFAACPFLACAGSGKTLSLLCSALAWQVGASRKLPKAALDNHRTRKVICLCNEVSFMLPCCRWMWSYFCPCSLAPAPSPTLTQVREKQRIEEGLAAEKAEIAAAAAAAAALGDDDCFVSDPIADPDVACCGGKGSGGSGDSKGSGGKAGAGRSPCGAGSPQWLSRVSRRAATLSRKAQQKDVQRSYSSSGHIC